MSRRIWAAIAVLGAGLSLDAQTPAKAAVSLFTQNIRPIFEKQCQACHNTSTKQSGLEITTREKLLRGGDHGPAVVPGKPEESLLYLYVSHRRQPGMPFGGKKLADEQIAQIAEWIRAGAPFDGQLEAAGTAPKRAATDHWAFRAPRRPATPAVKKRAWVRNPIDAFLAVEYEKNGLEPLPEADKYTLLRRVYLDLTGLPPTRDEIHAFLADRSENAYEKVVDRLLASPQYGERWGRHWMDVWRYSDWYGSGANEVRNSQRHIWRWRDWIIESLNEDKGYDRMILEMLAGDEIAPTDPKTLRATGFLVRNWFRFNRNVWLQDTIESVSASFLGVTLKCARCHDHKYDPFAQEEYYKFRAFFEPHDVRIDRVPGQADWKKAGIARVYDSAAKEALPPDPEEGTANLLPPIFGETYLFVRGDEKNPEKEHPLGPGVPEALGKVTAEEIKPIELTLEAYYPDMRDFVHVDLVEQAKQRIREAEAKREKAKVERASAQRALAEPKRPEPPGPAVDFKKNILLIFEQRCLNCHQGRNRKSGLSLASEKEVLAGGSKNGPAAIAGKSGESPLIQHLRGEKQPRMPFNGPPLPGEQIDLIARWIDRLPPKDPAVLLREADTQIQIAGKEIATAKAALVSLEARIAAEKAKYRTSSNVEALAEAARAADQQASLIKCEENVLRAQSKLSRLLDEPMPSDEAGKSARERNIAAARKDLETAVAALSGPRETYTPVGKIYPKTSTGRRLALARWIASKENPLTARVAVNHMWLRHFGVALVPTVTDFGKNGKPPTHLELLDWLATELIELDWGMKAVHRLMVTSNAYRMQSGARAEHSNQRIDPENRLLWRMNVRRMEAEVVRDSVLRAAGSLDLTMGGPELSDEADQDAPRRSLYFHLTPSAQLLFLKVFDGADPTNCYQRPESIVPQQALALANSKLSLTQARVLTDRLGGSQRQPEQFLADAYESVLGRPPSPAERVKSLKFLEQQETLFRGSKALTPFHQETNAASSPSIDAKMRAREDLIHTLFNRNEFVTIR